MKTLGIIFGGPAVEHEVSIITALQLIKHLDPNKYRPVPIYVDKAGRWWTGDQLTELDWYRRQDLSSPSGAEPFSLSLNPGDNDLDAAILSFHGRYGEGGWVQGVLEVAQVPYQGPGVTGAVIAFDKIVTRQILAAEGISQTDYIWFTAEDWQQRPAVVTEQVAQLGYPVFVKPANGGSTIGIQKVETEEQLAGVIRGTLQYDRRIMLEQEVADCIEVNVAVLGLGDEVAVSVPEQPLKKDELLSFADKYQRGDGKKSGMASANRRIPAPISADQTRSVQDLAKRLFKVFDLSGVVRIDFFVNPSTDDVYVTELNTIPGSMSYYLWQASDLEYSALIDRLVDIAERRRADQDKLVTQFENNLLETSKE